MLVFLDHVQTVDVEHFVRIDRHQDASGVALRVKTAKFSSVFIVLPKERTATYVDLLAVVTDFEIP